MQLYPCDLNAVSHELGVKIDVTCIKWPKKCFLSLSLVFIQFLCNLILNDMSKFRFTNSKCRFVVSKFLHSMLSLLCRNFEILSRNFEFSTKSKFRDTKSKFRAAVRTKSNFRNTRSKF